MRWRQLGKHLLGWLRPWQKAQTAPQRRGAMTHVVILDGTMSSLKPGEETNAGLAYRLLTQVGAPVSLFYEAGIQWRHWRSASDVIVGRGTDGQIRRAYGWLASRYRPGDRIFLLGYSRGAFAVRSLAGVIDQVGLLRAEEATERRVRTAWRHYQSTPGSPAERAFRRAYCHEGAAIEMLGCFDTVMALGLRWPLIWRWMESPHDFHNYELCPVVRHGFHALALHETREAFAPILWSDTERFEGTVEQVWFPGAHGDVGGQLGGYEAARPLSNIPFVWMMEKAEGCGLPLPEGWRARFPVDPSAPSCGTWKGWGKLFLIRKRRIVGADPSERVHESAAARDIARSGGAAGVVRGSEA
ncbi:DUF2235 domain-containing protein [Rhodalgimonas zhirmunskyi]|uniref:DUF2235 domain-containing protein n=1 Tax=Rhodalgimonas zhirmunskyi TaxID=2964767 RepID=A0AAJ1U9E1_9RHOB|nr:DUF2235 domain-containing protein [Rhodoalgimonas zhirmunskyi]MDQ2095731.1 DUF2235 domain-containing protein [Rhodoalgimonas zhirmunskyi]